MSTPDQAGDPAARAAKQTLHGAETMPTALWALWVSIAAMIGLVFLAPIAIGLGVTALLQLQKKTEQKGQKHAGIAIFVSLFAIFFWVGISIVFYFFMIEQTKQWQENSERQQVSYMLMIWTPDPSSDGDWPDIRSQSTQWQAPFSQQLGYMAHSPLLDGGYGTPTMGTPAGGLIKFGDYWFVVDVGNINQLKTTRTIVVIGDAQLDDGRRAVGTADQMVSFMTDDEIRDLLIKQNEERIERGVEPIDFSQIEDEDDL